MVLMPKKDQACEVLFAYIQWGLFHQEHHIVLPCLCVFVGVAGVEECHNIGLLRISFIHFAKGKQMKTTQQFLVGVFRLADRAAT